MLLDRRDLATDLSKDNGMRLVVAVTIGLAYLLSAPFSLAQNQTPSSARNSRPTSQQRTPALLVPQSQEETVVADIPSYGFVRGTPAALASLVHPLAPAPGRNDLVAACRAIVEKSAEAHEAARVEAVSAGPQRRVRDVT